jgi:hypothetical protein
VQLVLKPPTIVDGLSVTDETRAVVTVNDVVFVDASKEALSVTTTFELTGVVVTVNWALSEFKPTVTEDGTWATELFELRLTTSPGLTVAFPLSVTVPVVVVPPGTVAAATDTLATVGCPPGKTVSDVVWVEAPSVAVKVTEV